MLVKQCTTITNPCCPPCVLTGELCVFDPVSCYPPENLNGVLTVINPVVTPNCVTLIFSAPKSDETYTITGTDCCGESITLRVSYPHTVSNCFDLNFPFTYDPALNPPVVAGNCDCDPNPPFDCFCILPRNGTDDPPGNFSGNSCDGTPFDMEVVSGLSYEPICVRADGLHTKSASVTLQNLGDCTTDGLCRVPLCVNKSYTGLPIDETPGGGNVSGLLCNGDSFSIDLINGESSGFLCVQAGSVTITGNIGEFTINGPCI